MVGTGDWDCGVRTRITTDQAARVGQVTSSWMICSFKGKKKESIFNEECVDFVWMFIKYFFQPQTGSEDRGEETSNYDVPHSLSERQRRGEAQSFGI